jgi:hypothetical protein
VGPAAGDLRRGGACWGRVGGWGGSARQLGRHLAVGVRQALPLCPPSTGSPSCPAWRRRA